MMRLSKTEPDTSAEYSTSTEATELSKTDHDTSAEYSTTT